jgi:7-dehydrocholesterol reductase
MHDRAGFYICWGTLVWVPAIYTASTLYLVNHPVTLGLPLSLTIGALGVASIGIGYLADSERRRARATDGACSVWGKPARVIRARYATATGESRENVLLVSGFWGLSRHFHYAPEILGAIFWTLPVGVNHALPWFYVVYLTLLLLHRADRDDKRCAQKYGAAWDAYRRLVPYRIVPGLF